MNGLDFKIVDAGLWMADCSETDLSGLWTVTEPDSPYGATESEMFDCAIRHYSDDWNKYPIKHLASFETLRKAIEYLKFLWQNGKNYNSLKVVEYKVAPVKCEFQLP